MNRNSPLRTSAGMGAAVGGLGRLLGLHAVGLEGEGHAWLLGDVPTTWVPGSSRVKTMAPATIKPAAMIAPGTSHWRGERCCSACAGSGTSSTFESWHREGSPARNRNREP